MAAHGVTIVPHPMPCDRQHGTPASRTGPCVLFVGGLEANKNPGVIVRAAPLVLKEVPDAKFIFVGDDYGDMEKLRAMADAAGVGSSMEWTGRLDRAKIEPLRGQARVCVVPSKRETFGLVAAEAMAAGRPVIGSRIDGLRDVIGDGETGFLVNPEDPAQWATAMIRILNDPELASAMGERGYQCSGALQPRAAAARREAVYLRALAAWTGRRFRPISTQTAPSAAAVSRAMFNLLPSLNEARGVVKTAHPPLSGYRAQRAGRGRPTTMWRKASADPHRPLQALMDACGATMGSSREFYWEVNRAYHTAEAPVYEQLHLDMGTSCRSNGRGSCRHCRTGNRARCGGSTSDVGPALSDLFSVG